MALGAFQELEVTWRRVHTRLDLGVGSGERVHTQKSSELAVEDSHALGPMNYPSPQIKKEKVTSGGDGGNEPFPFPVGV